jgi:ABC-type nitrate/sulfonate/bicarbonate transport system substrate-binding protein
MAVDSVVGSADLFADEVVAALGGDPAAGLQLNERMLADGLKVDAVLMSEFRRSNAAEHARRLNAIRAAQEKAQAEADAAERRAQEEAQKQPLVVR